jgi:predicted Zn-dependent peptidase
MNKLVLSNGLTVINAKKPAKTCSLVILVRTGSNFEQQEEKGVSHFIEHMLFEGTKKRSALDITRTIEGIGGEIGAYTTHDRTCFYVKGLPKHFDTALDVLHDIITSPVFRPKEIKKERQVILHEINMKLDEPRFLQWDLFLEAVFNKHPVSSPIIGTAETVAQLSRKQLIDYYHSHYVPGNITVAYAGPNTGVKAKITRKFSGLRQRPVPLFAYPEASSNKRKIVRKNISQSYLILGFKTVPRKNKDSFALEVIRAILGRGLSGRVVNEIRTRRGYAYDVGCLHEASKDYGFFSVYLSTQKRNLKKSEEIIRRELNKLHTVTPREMEEAKNFLEGEYIMELEDVQKHAEASSFWDFCGLGTNIHSYVSSIQKVTKKDIIAVAEKHLTESTLTILRQK